MVAHHQITLGYSIISQQIIHFFCIHIFWLMNLLKWFSSVKSLIYGNDYLTFYNEMDQNGNFALHAKAVTAFACFENWLS